MKKLLINIHSLVDLITNSSTEIFIIDENKVKETMKEIFQFIVNEAEIDYESTVEKFDDYEYKDDYILSEEYKNNSSNLYIIHASQHNELLNSIIEKFFNPIELEYKEI
jgi:hypothetical protein